ncbi:hypothetical protein L916_06311, partial [Phytophthora nicotianae]
GAWLGHLRGTGAAEQPAVVPDNDPPSKTNLAVTRACAKCDYSRCSCSTAKTTAQRQTASGSTKRKQLFMR